MIYPGMYNDLDKKGKEIVNDIFHRKLSQIIYKINKKTKNDSTKNDNENNDNQQSTCLLYLKKTGKFIDKND